MSVYNIRYIKFFLDKLDWTGDNFRPWLRLRKWYPVVLSGGSSGCSTWPGRHRLNDATELLSTKEARHDYLAYVMCVCVWPASRIRVTTVAVLDDTKPRIKFEPQDIGTPAMCILSLMASVLPDNLPLLAPTISVIHALHSLTQLPSVCHCKNSTNMKW